MDGILAALRSVPYLAALPESELALLARQSTVWRVGRGGVLFHEGAPPAGLLILMEGRAKVVRVSGEGREQVLHVEGAGAALGEVPVFDGEGYVATAVALDAVRALFVPRDPLLDLCRRRPDVALGIVAALARRLRTFAGLIEDLSLRDVTGRVARFLTAEARRHGATEILVPGTREELAARLGTVRELVSRALSELKLAGLLDVSGRRVRILDPRRLSLHGEARVRARAGRRDGDDAGAAPRRERPTS